ncbi:Aminopeptidase rnpepl1, partial [Coemansia sp. RSA 2618]
MFEVDPNSQANLADITTEHVHLDLAVDFAGKKLVGTAAYRLAALASTQEVVLDTAHLKIGAARLKHTDGSLTDLAVDTSTVHKIYGTALRVLLPEPVAAGDKLAIEIDYETSPDSGAIQFLTPEQTLGKSHPYLFTQCEEIHARSLLPCQDSPSVKISYSASVRVPKPLTALMSAIATGSSDEGDSIVFSFEQQITIPSYLVALVVGNLTSAKISDRCAVWSEPENIDA